MGFRGTRDRVILVVRECICKELGVLLALPLFDDTGSLYYPPRSVVYRPLVSTLVAASRFLAGNREAELEHTPFSLLLLFRIFRSSLLSYPLQRYYSTLITD